jgi:peptidyl-prolyl cis-trans isomerase D
MLEKFRNLGKTWVAKILLMMLAGSFGVWGIRDIFGGYNASALATVGSQEISGLEYTNSYRRALQNLAQQTGQALTAEDARKMGLDRSILNNLIQSAVIDAEAANLKLNVSPRQIAEEAQSNPAFHNAQGKFDPQDFARVLQQNGMNEAMFVQAETRNKLRNAITSAVDRGFAPPKALIEAMSLYQTEQRDAKYFLITATEADVAAPTDEELKKQYEATPVAYTAPEYRSIAVMKVEPADIAGKISITADDLAKGYEQYKLDYYTPEKRTVLQLSFPSVDEAKKAKEKIAAGTDFMVLAKERGATDADVTFADKAKTDFLDKVIADAAFALKEGDVSDPVSGSLVTAILKVTKITPEKQLTLDEVRADLTTRLQTEKAQDEIQSIYDAVEDGRAAQTKFEDIAKAQGIPFQLIASVSAAGLDPAEKDVAIPDKQDLLKAAFDSDVGVENNALTPKDGYYWYEVREVVPSVLKPFDTVKAQVKSDVVAAKIRELLTERGTKLVANLKSGASFETVAGEAKAVVKTSQGLRRNEASADFDVPAVTALFSVPENGFAWSLEGDGKSAKIIQSQTVLATPFDITSAAAKELTKTIATAQSKDILTSYLTALQGQIGVSINDALWQQLSGTPQASP